MDGSRGADGGLFTGELPGCLPGRGEEVLPEVVFPEEVLAGDFLRGE